MKIIIKACVLFSLMIVLLSANEKLPFIGKKSFNFAGGSGTGQTIEINDNGFTLIQLHGKAKSLVLYKGAYQKSMPISADTEYVIEGNEICEANPMEYVCTRMYDLDKVVQHDMSAKKREMLNFMLGEEIECKNGNAERCYFVGNLYLHGADNLDPSPAKGKEFLQMSCKLGYSKGCALTENKPVSKNVTENKASNIINAANVPELSLKGSVGFGKVNAHMIELISNDFSDEKCEFGYSLDNNLYFFSKVDSNCVNLINSKGVKIICTPKKKMCKTREEVRDFISNTQVVKNTNQLLKQDEKNKSKDLTGLDSKKITNSVGMTFVKIPEGSFTMGTPIDCPKDDPFTRKNEYKDCEEKLEDYGIPAQQKSVKSFYMQTTEVTQSQWYQVMGNNPSEYKSDSIGFDSRNNPVERISWADIKLFIKKLNELEGTNVYYVPNEIEWEYAARAGTTSKWSFGNSESSLGKYGWYHDNSKSRTNPVAKKKPNSWGLYDMYGNVEELTDSCYKKRLDDVSCTLIWGNIEQVRRGGSYFDYPNKINSTFRAVEADSFPDSHTGFRVARTLHTAANGQERSSNNLENKIAISSVVAKIESACNFGSMEACTDLGIKYADGAGVKKDVLKAKTYLERACNESYGTACTALGIIYDKGGEGLERSKYRAKMYLEEGCELGDESGCRLLQLGAMVGY